MSGCKFMWNNGLNVAHGGALSINGRQKVSNIKIVNEMNKWFINDHILKINYGPEKQEIVNYR